MEKILFSYAKKVTNTVAENGIKTLITYIGFTFFLFSDILSVALFRSSTDRFVTSGKQMF